MTPQKEKSQSNDYKKALAAYTTAMKDFHKGKFDTSIELLEKFKKTYPQEKKLIDRTDIYLRISRDRTASPQAALKTFKDFYQHGLDMMSQGKYTEALDALNKAHDKKPKNGRVLYLMADVYCLSGEIDTCLENLEKAVELEPDIAILAQNEADFMPVKEDPRFSEIINKE